MEKVDVVINVYGKPYQTICTLKSLMLYCSEYIDKIFFIMEKEQPFGDTVDWVVKEFDNIEVYVPNTYSLFINRGNYKNDSFRLNIRHQYGIENSNKKYVFITHNDILYTGDIIKELLTDIEGFAGSGSIGQCWNCPVFYAKKCDGSYFYNFNPTREDVVFYYKNYKHGRSPWAYIDPINPKPLPECRLNEFACIIDREITMKECEPNGNTVPFGTIFFDSGTEWFKSLHLKGYKFKHYDIKKKSIHGFFVHPDGEKGGYPVQLDQKEYLRTEQNAKEYYEKHFKL